MKKTEIYYVVDEKNIVYSYYFGGILSEFFRNVEFNFFRKKYPNKKFYKLSTDMLTLLEHYDIDKDFWGDTDE